MPLHRLPRRLITRARRPPTRASPMSGCCPRRSAPLATALTSRRQVHLGRLRQSHWPRVPGDGPSRGRLLFGDFADLHHVRPAGPRTCRGPSPRPRSPDPDLETSRHGAVARRTGTSPLRSVVPTLTSSSPTARRPRKSDNAPPPWTSTPLSSRPCAGPYATRCASLHTLARSRRPCACAAVWMRTKVPSWM